MYNEIGVLHAMHQIEMDVLIFWFAYLVPSRMEKHVEVYSYLLTYTIRKWPNPLMASQKLKSRSVSLWLMRVSSLQSWYFGYRFHRDMCSQLVS